MVKPPLKILLIFFLLPAVIWAQEEKEISTKRYELSGIKTEIKQLEDELRQKTAEEKKSLSVLDNYNKQNFLLNKLINSLRSEEKAKQNQILKTSASIKKLETDINLLKKNYAKYVVSVYKYGTPNELEGLLDAESVQQGIRRIKYLQKFSESRERDLIKLQTKVKDLESAKVKLQQEKKEKAKLAGDKVAEENNLMVKLKERKQFIDELKTDKAEINKELAFRKASEEQIKNIIAKLVEEAERKKREAAERLAKLKAQRLQRESLAKNNDVDIEKNTNIIPTRSDETLNLDTEKFSSFSALRGRMIWPLAGGKVTRSFGENRNPKLKTVTINYGVDIKSSGSLDVNAVAEGIVSAIDWIPGYGSVIIITHKGDYRTVYSHLSEIYISEGDKVKMGARIAKVGESLEGDILHFEIWNSRKNQNPEVWLARK